MSYDQYRLGGFKILPPVVKNLLIINVIFFFAAFVLESQNILDLTSLLGLYHPSSELFEPYQLVTYIFMHGGVEHLFFNMFAVWMFGNLLENYWGAKKFLVYYMITGIGAGLIQILYTSYSIAPLYTFINAPSLMAFMELSSNFNANIIDFIEEWTLSPNSKELGLQASKYVTQLLEFKLNIPTVGASGSLFGILLAFGMLFPNTKLYLYFLFPIKAKYFVIGYGLLELFSGISNVQGDNIAHFAHLGGMLFGFILIKYWQKRSNIF